MEFEKKKITIEDVAKHAKVSLATVSRVINKSGKVKDETRQSVLKAIDELGYELKGSGMDHNVILVISSHRFSSPFYDKIFMGIQQSAESHGYDCIDYVCSDIDADCENIISKISYLNVSGVITIEYIKYEATLKAIEAYVPLVQCAVYNPELECSFFSWNYEVAAEDAVKYLISLNRKRIAFLNGSEQRHFQMQFLNGYKKALESADMEIDPNYIVNLPHDTVDNQYAVAFSAARQLLQLKEKRPDAIFCSDEAYAAAAVSAALRAGVKIPEELAVIGSGDTIVSMICTPKLSTIHQDCFELGCSAVEHLLVRATQHSSSICQTYFNCELIMRETT